jgi:periplasmic divalent cation tolerance protein
MRSEGVTPAFLLIFPSGGENPIKSSLAMPKKAAYRLILSTCPDRRTAGRLAKRLVGERLAACVNVIPVARSVYRWKGKIESAKEMLLVIKARAADYKRIEARIRMLHPYTLPEIIAIDITQGSARYLAWIKDPDKVQ